MKNTVYEYSVEELSETYNGAGERGTGGPKDDWLKRSADIYIRRNHPDLQKSHVVKLLAAEG